MTNEIPAMDLRTIGFVRSEIKEPVRRDWKSVVSEIVIDSKLAEALDGLDGFSHIIVIYWMHRAFREGLLKIHPEGGKRNCRSRGSLPLEHPTDQTS